MAELHITKDNFETEVWQSDKTVLLDFWATWCGPCRMLAPILEEIAEELHDTVTVGKVNVDEEPALAQAFSVSSIPMLVVIRNGKVVGTDVGYMPKERVLKLLAE